MTWRWIAPWLLILLALPAALIIFSATAPVACGELQGAFTKGVTTQASEYLSGLVSRCETVGASDGSTNAMTVVNWSGLIAAGALLVGIWFLGAWLTGIVSRRRSLGVVIAAGATGLVAVVAFFL